ncbi:hypothetical protein [Sorangium sp. So ce406]|uniref:hypothetical protein n=1 Tax=Sorangium sp. So ce406 TaxID=3133311 RepID=UPI003F5C2627
MSTGISFIEIEFFTDSVRSVMADTCDGAARSAQSELIRSVCKLSELHPQRQWPARWHLGSLQRAASGPEARKGSVEH